MPEQQPLKRARKKQREGKAPSTQAGEFVREEMKHIHQGNHGAASRRQAIAIGLSKARQAGIDVAARKPTTQSSASKRTRKKPAKN